MERLVLVRCPELAAEDEGGAVLRTFAAVLDAVRAYCPWVAPVRPGVLTLPARGPARFFGGEDAVVDLLARALAETGVSAEIGVGDGLFCAHLAATTGQVVPSSATVGFLTPWSVATMERPELATLLQRLGLRTLGAFADLPERHVLERLGSDGVACHHVARGRSGELPGWRDPGIARRLDRLARTGAPSTQGGFWGGRQQADLVAAEALRTVQQILGPEAVVVPRREGGRTPLAQVRLTTWSATEGVVPVPEERPWPGQIPSPAPAALYRTPRPVELVDATGSPVTVDGRELSAPAARLSVAGGPWTDLVAWAGPWPLWERWWTSAKRRGAHLQVVTSRGLAHLLLAQREGWSLVATYD